MTVTEEEYEFIKIFESLTSEQQNAAFQFLISLVEDFENTDK